MVDQIIKDHAARPRGHCRECVAATRQCAFIACAPGHARIGQQFDCGRCTGYVVHVTCNMMYQSSAQHVYASKCSTTSRRVHCAAHRRSLLAAMAAQLAVLSSKADAIQASTAAGGAGDRSPSSQPSSSRPPACSRLDPALAAELLNSVSTAVATLQLTDEQQFQKERFKLQQREYRYYYDANADELPRVPDLSDSSGGLSNPTYFNFVSYMVWKVAARYAATPEQRSQLVTTAGQLLLQRVAPDLKQRLQQQAAAGGGHADGQQLVAACEDLLQRLQSAGYICTYQITWGQLPGGWSADWGSQPGVVGEPVQAVLPPPQQPFQVKLNLPADVQGSVALRAEEDGFWGRQVSSMLLQLLAAGGYGETAVDEYFYQDYWSGPRSVADKVLLLLGDPLQQVVVPWTPTTLVQDWTLGAA